MQASPSTSRAIMYRRLFWFAVVTVATFAFAARLGHEPLWLDETYSFAMVQHGFVDILRLTTSDVHPPLYYLILKVTTLLIGSSPVALRVPSLLATVGLLALAAGPVQRVWGERTARVFAILVATSPGILCFTQEARMYALATLFVTGAALYGHLVIQEERPSNLFWYGAFTWAAAMTHYFALVAVGMNGLYLLTVVAVKERRRLKTTATSHRHRFRPLSTMVSVVYTASGYSRTRVLDSFHLMESAALRLGRSLHVQVRGRSLSLASTRSFGSRSSNYRHFTFPTRSTSIHWNHR